MTDFEIIKRTNWPFASEYAGSFALIPTLTSVSRQSLFTGLYPQQMENQFSLTKEEAGFYQAAASLGYSKEKTLYDRGYEPKINPQVRLAAIIINDIDDIMHGQQQGDTGMHQDVQLMAQKGKLQLLIRRLLFQGFRVYLASDHGHIQSLGNGQSVRLGLEAESKAQRVVVLRDFAEATEALTGVSSVFPGTYLKKDYQYYLAKGNTAFTTLGRQLVTHGGISIEEVIVPFISITGVK